MYMVIKSKPSILPSFLLTRRNNPVKRVTPNIIGKSIAIKKESAFKGLTALVIPKTAKILNTLLPIKLPTEILD